MRICLKRAGKALLAAVIALLLAPTIVPPFLDRIYYQGPVSDHFDGERFFNPDRARPSDELFRASMKFLFDMATGRGFVPWPRHVAVTPGLPPAGATPCPPGREIENRARCTRTYDPQRMFVTWVGHS